MPKEARRSSTARQRQGGRATNGERAPSPPTTSFTIPDEVVPKGRPRLNRKTGTLYTPKETKIYEEVVGLVVKSTRTCYSRSQAVRVECTIYTKKGKPPDCDNAAKSILDGMQKGGLLEDDSQVWELYVKRIVSSTPRVEVVVSPIEVESEG